MAFNRLPERWFCDYGAEVPAKREQRLKPLIAIPVFFAVMAAAWYFGLSFFPNIKAFAVLLFVFFCLCASAADIVYKILPDQFIMAIAASALVFPAVDYKRFYIYLLGALAGALVIFLIGFLGKLFFKTEAMGFGDVKLNAALGLACGLYGTLYALLIAILTGALAAVPLSLFQRTKSATCRLRRFSALARWRQFFSNGNLTLFSTGIFRCFKPDTYDGREGSLYGI